MWEVNDDASQRRKIIDYSFPWPVETSKDPTR